MKIRWNFQFNYSGKLEVLCIKSPKKVHKILVHKIQQALTEFFSETLWKWMSVAFKFTRNRKKGLFRKDSPTKAKREQVIFENYFTGKRLQDIHNDKQFIIIKILQTSVK